MSRVVALLLAVLFAVLAVSVTSATPSAVNTNIVLDGGDVNGNTVVEGGEGEAHGEMVAGGDVMPPMDEDEDEDGVTGVTGHIVENAGRDHEHHHKKAGRHHKKGVRRHKKGGRRHRGGRAKRMMTKLTHMCRTEKVEECFDDAHPGAILSCLRQHDSYLSLQCKGLVSKLPHLPNTVSTVLSSCHEQAPSVCPAPQRWGQLLRKLRGHRGHHGGKRRGHGHGAGRRAAHMAKLVQCLEDKKAELTGECADAVNALPDNWHSVLKQEVQAGVHMMKVSGLEEGDGEEAGDEEEGVDEMIDDEDDEDDEDEDDDDDDDDGDWEDLVVGGVTLVGAVGILVFIIKVIRRCCCRRCRRNTDTVRFTELTTTAQPSTTTTVRGNAVDFA